MVLQAAAALVGLWPLAATVGDDCGLGTFPDPATNAPFQCCTGFACRAAVFAPAPAPPAKGEVLPCLPPQPDRCDLDFTECASVAPGGTCEVLCRSPFFGAPGVASCPDHNVDAVGGLVWQYPSCSLVCPEVSPPPLGYRKSGDGSWVCDDGFAGNVTAVCRFAEEVCAAELELTGCDPFVPCAPLLMDPSSEDFCKFHVLACFSVDEGNNCEVSCEPPYVGVSTFASCPENNTDPLQPLSWTAPSCELKCVDPSNQDPGYVESTTPGRIAECASGFIGKAVASCTISDFLECEAVLSLRGCRPPPQLVPCAPLRVSPPLASTPPPARAGVQDDRCELDVSTCAHLGPGETCEVSCVSPFAGESTTASCSFANSDATTPPAWTRPVCEPICQEPALPSVGYVRVEGGWACDIGFEGIAVVYCVRTPYPTCRTELVYEGCLPLIPVHCGPLWSEDVCKFTTLGCYSVAPGDLCIVYCRAPFRPAMSSFTAGWPAYCDKLNGDQNRPPKCLGGMSYSNYTTCWDFARCELDCEPPTFPPEGYDGDAISGWRCAEGFHGSPASTCVARAATGCVPEMQFSGCYLMSTCQDPPEVSCSFDVSSCVALHPNETCEVTCRRPYLGTPTTAQCPAGNTDPSTLPIILAPQCKLVCSDPPLPFKVGYRKLEGSIWDCDDGFIGMAVVTCEVKAPPSCEMLFAYSGCQRLLPCAPLLVGDPCGINVSRCASLLPGASCQVACGSAYSGQAVTAVCPHNNTDARQIPIIQGELLPTCTLSCPLSVVPIGYVRSATGMGSWSCSAGYGPRAQASCLIDNVTCEGKLVAKGCKFLNVYPCSNLSVQDPCMYEVPKECNSLGRGATCEVRCGAPYVPRSSVAHCPSNNSDPNKGPDWEPPWCEPLCADPDTTTQSVYVGTAKSPRCAAGYYGEPQVRCIVNEACEAELRLSGCDPAQDCTVLPLADPCRLEGVGCSSVPGGEACEVQCKWPYKGTHKAVARCPENNTLRYRPLEYTEPTCNLGCPVPEFLPLGYLDLLWTNDTSMSDSFPSTVTRWVCAAGFVGETVATCSVPQSDCLPMFALTGCLQQRPCASIMLVQHLSCVVDVPDDCTNMTVGSSCTISCKATHLGSPTVAICPVTNTNPYAEPTYELPVCEPQCDLAIATQVPQGYIKRDMVWSCASGYYGTVQVGCSVEYATCDTELVFTGCVQYSNCAALPPSCMFDSRDCSSVRSGSICSLACKSPYKANTTIASCPANNKDPKTQLVFADDPPCVPEDCAEMNYTVGYIKDRGVWKCAPGFSLKVVGVAPTYECTVPLPLCKLQGVVTGCVLQRPCAPFVPNASYHIDASKCKNVMAGDSCAIPCEEPYVAANNTFATCPAGNVDPNTQLAWQNPQCFLGVSCRPPCDEDLELVAPGTCTERIPAGGSCWTTCRYGNQGMCALQTDRSTPTWSGGGGWIFLLVGPNGYLHDAVQEVSDSWIVASYPMPVVIQSIDVKWGQSVSIAYDVYAIYDRTGSQLDEWRLIRRFEDMPNEVGRVDSFMDVVGNRTTKVKFLMRVSHAWTADFLEDKYSIDEITIWTNTVDQEPAHTVFSCPKDNLDPQALPQVWRKCKLFCDICAYNFVDADSRLHTLSAPNFGTGNLVRMGIFWEASEGLFHYPVVSNFRVVFADRSGQRVGNTMAAYGDMDPTGTTVRTELSECCYPWKYSKVIPATRVPDRAASVRLMLITPEGEVLAQNVGRRIAYGDWGPSPAPRGQVTTGKEDISLGKDTCDLFLCTGFYAEHGHRRRRIRCGGKTCYSRECCQLRMPQAETPFYEKELYGYYHTVATAQLSRGRAVVCTTDPEADCSQIGGMPDPCAEIHCYLFGPSGELVENMETRINFDSRGENVGLTMTSLSGDLAIICYTKGWFGNGYQPPDVGVCRLVRGYGPFFDGGLNRLDFGPECIIHLGYTGPSYSVGQMRLQGLNDSSAVLCYTAYRPFVSWDKNGQAMFCNLLVLLGNKLVEARAPVYIDNTSYTSFGIARLYPHETANAQEPFAGFYATTTTTTTTPQLRYGETTLKITTTSTTTTTEQGTPTETAVVCYVRPHIPPQGWVRPNSQFVKFVPNNYGMEGLREIKCCVLTDNNLWGEHRRRTTSSASRSLGYEYGGCVYVANVTDSVTLSQAGPGMAVLCYRNGGGNRCALLVTKGTDKTKLLLISDLVVQPLDSRDTEDEFIGQGIVPKLLGNGRLAVCYRSFKGAGGNATRMFGLSNGTLFAVGELICAGLIVTDAGLEVQTDHYFQFSGKVVVGWTSAPSVASLPGFDLQVPAIVPFGNDSVAVARRSILVCDTTRMQQGGWRLQCGRVTWNDVKTTTSTTTTTPAPRKAPPVPPDRRRIPRKKFFTTVTTTTLPFVPPTPKPSAAKVWDYEFTTTKKPPPYSAGVYIRGSIRLEVVPTSEICGRYLPRLEEVVARVARWTVLACIAKAQAADSVIQGTTIYSTDTMTLQTLLCNINRRLGEDNSKTTNPPIGSFNDVAQFESSERRLALASIDFEVRVADGAAAAALASANISVADPGNLETLFTVAWKDLTGESVANVSLLSLGSEVLVPVVYTTQTTTTRDSFWVEPTTSTKAAARAPTPVLVPTYWPVAEPNRQPSMAPTQAPTTDASVLSIGILIACLVTCLCCILGNGFVVFIVFKKFYGKSADEKVDDFAEDLDSRPSEAGSMVEAEKMISVAQEYTMDMDLPGASISEPSQELMGHNKSSVEHIQHMMKWREMRCESQAYVPPQTAGSGASVPRLAKAPPADRPTVSKLLDVKKLPAPVALAGRGANLRAMAPQYVAFPSNHPRHFNVHKLRDLGHASLAPSLQSVSPKSSRASIANRGGEALLDSGLDSIEAEVTDSRRRSIALEAPSAADETLCPWTPQAGAAPEVGEDATPSAIVPLGSEVDAADVALSPTSVLAGLQGDTALDTSLLAAFASELTREEQAARVQAEADAAHAEKIRLLKAAAEEAVSSRFPGLHPSAKKFLSGDGAVYAQHGGDVGSSWQPRQPASSTVAAVGIRSRGGHSANSARRANSQDAAEEPAFIRTDGELPAGWVAKKSSGGAMYYYHEATRQVQWHHPTLPRPG